MYFTKSVAVAILAFTPSVVFGQSNVVQLGQNNNLMFTPNMMTVEAGQNMTFQFMSAAHGVMSTSLNAPNVADNQVYSGIIPVNNQTPNPPGKTLPKRKLRIRGAAPFGYVEGAEEEKRGLAALLSGAAGNAANNGQLTVQNSGQAGPATFTVQMNTVGMQAFVCPAAQHAANGMIMMVNVVPAGQASNKEKRQSSDAALNQAFQNYLAVGQNTKTVVPTAQPGTGGQLNAVGASVAQTQNKNGKAKKNSQGQTVAAPPVFTGDN